MRRGFVRFGRAWSRDSTGAARQAAPPEAHRRRTADGRHSHPTLAGSVGFLAAHADDSAARAR